MKRFFVALALALATFGFGGLASAAAVPYRPDAQIARAGQPLIGDNYYNSDGTNQTAKGSVRVGGTVVFDVAFTNDGSTSDTFTVFGCPARPRHDGFSVAYFEGETDVSEQLRFGTFQRTVAPGSSTTLRLEMRIRKWGLDRPRRCLTRVVSQGAPVEDVVLAVVRQRR